LGREVLDGSGPRRRSRRNADRASSWGRYFSGLGVPLPNGFSQRSPSVILCEVHLAKRRIIGEPSGDCFKAAAAGLPVRVDFNPVLHSALLLDLDHRHRRLSSSDGTTRLSFFHCRIGSSLSGICSCSPSWPLDRTTLMAARDLRLDRLVGAGVVDRERLGRDRAEPWSGCRGRREFVFHRTAAL